MRGRAARLLHAAAAGCALAAVPLAWCAAADPRQWLEKMSHALATRNYDGTFFHVSDGRVEMMRIVHRVKGGRVIERLQSLEGSGREFIRNDDQLTCYLPDEHTVLVELRQKRGPFLSSLPKFGSGVERFYRIESLPDARLLGKLVHVIAVNPTDRYRFGYRLWLDRRTAMPLKTQLYDSQGRVLEQIIFAQLKMPKTIPASDLEPAVSTAGMRWIVQSPSANASAAVSAFRASELPPGFRLTVAAAQTLGGAKRPAEHLVYSDGLATVSVFVEPGRGRKPALAAAAGAASAGSAAAAAPAPTLRGLAHIGSGFAFSTMVAGHQVTAVGEVPAETVEFIAHSVKSFGAGVRPQPRLPPP
ncbi:MAG TPA: MucB/RseB C-terminal domain-containing protein [Steroidobacteraceae bacterium]|nr:MucB/RseB C-terminal domain-containing protein [Steroidobacteraceae bacterium]